MSKTSLADASASKAMAEGKDSIDVVPIDPEITDHELDGLAVLAPPTNEPVVTRRELWSYYREYCLDVILLEFTHLTMFSVL